MDYSTPKLIQSYASNAGVLAATFSTLGSSKTKFNIPVSNFGKFINDYCELAYDEDSVNLSIGECVENKTTIPLMGIFKFKFEVEDGSEEEVSYFGDDLPLAILKCYQKAMSELLNISTNMSELICCILQNHSYKVRSGIVYIDLVLHFPFCQLDINFTRKVFRPYVEKLLRANKILNMFDTPVMGDWKELLINPGDVIPMYRSTPESNIPYLNLEHIYGIIEDKHIERSVAPEIPLGSIFKVATHSFIYSGKIPFGSIPTEPDEDEDEYSFYNFWTPLFLSIHFWSGQTIPKEIEVDESDMSKKTVFYDVENSESNNPITMAQCLLPLLATKRANEDYSWLDVGRVMYNIYKGSDEGLKVWIDFSSRATVPARDKQACTYKYPEFRANNMLSIATIGWYAKQDNPEAYKNWHNTWCMKALNECLSLNHTDIADAIYRVFWLDYVYADSGYWYEYRNHHYYRINNREPIAFRKKINEVFVKIFEKMRFDLTGESYRASPEEAGKKDMEYKIKAVCELVKRLKNENFRTTVIKTTKDYFHIEEFEEKCDRNHFLTALSNCVLEVVEKRVRPRPGKPEDFVTKFSNIEYPMEFTWESYWVKELIDWVNKITAGDKEYKHYFLKRMASFLRGLNPEKMFDVWTNAGNNGKSMFVKTLQTAFGSYFIDFPTTLLTGGGGKNSSGPSPELAQANNARGAVISETDDRETMKSGIIKRITGGDRIFTRKLNENGGSMEMTFKTIMICNRIPDIANADKALINRFVIFPFLGTWTDSAPDDIEEQFKQRKFKMDHFFDSKIPDLARALIWVCVQYYKYYAEEGLTFPGIIKDYIKKHWEDNDPYLQFIADRLEYAYKDKDKKEIDYDSTLTANDLYPFFKRWYQDNYPGVQVCNIPQFKSDMCMDGRLGNQPVKNCWLGVKLKNIVPELGGGVKI